MRRYTSLNGEAERILAIGKSNAESYKLSVEAIGGNNFTQLKVMDAIGTYNLKKMPDLLIGGSVDSVNGRISSLPVLILLEEIGRKNNPEENKL